ncbi:MAG: hypothetical protein DMF51_11800, partial [Acidobacteria bacterium]
MSLRVESDRGTHPRVDARDTPIVRRRSGSRFATDSGVPGELSDFRYCPACGAQNRPENRFCLKDGTPLPPIDTTRRMPGFVRSPGTYSPEEIEQVMHRVSQSVVRIRVR